MDCILTIDLGTNAVQLFAFTLNGTAIGTQKAAYPTFHRQPDYSEQDPEQVFITVLYSLKNFLNEKIHPAGYRVTAICFSAAMHSVLPVDKKGVPLGHAITWSDNRSKQEAQQLKDSALGHTIYNATGTPIHPMSPLVKIAWMKNQDQERFAQTARFHSLKSYVLQQLTGEEVIDYSLASATGLFNIHQFRWEQAALEYAGITAVQLPELVPVFYTMKPLKKEYRQTLGLQANTRLVAGASDGCLATLGAGVWGNGKATITIEQSAAVRVAGKQVLHDPQQRLFNYVLTEQHYVSGGPTNNGGMIFEWFAKEFGTFRHAFDLENCMEQLIREASGVPAGSGGLLFLPYLQGERAPIWNANARGLYFGINLQHSKQHFIRATIEGILFELFSIGKTLEEYRSIDTLSVNGSFTAYPFWAQLLADIFHKPVIVNNNFDSIGLGAYLLTATGMGMYESLEKAIPPNKTTGTYLPDGSNHRLYMQYFALFERLSHKLAEEFEEITRLQMKNKTA